MATGYHTQDVASSEHCQTSKMCILGKQLRVLEVAWLLAAAAKNNRSWVCFEFGHKYVTCVHQKVSILQLLYYENIKRYINQREFGSFRINLFRANKRNMQIFLALIYNNMEK